MSMVMDWRISTFASPEGFLIAFLSSRKMAAFGIPRKNQGRDGWNPVEVPFWLIWIMMGIRISWLFPTLG